MATESSIISMLETSNSRGISSLGSEFLQPFSDVKNPKKCSKSSKPREDSSTIRSLAKKFLPFLNRALSILPKRLSEPSKLGNDKQLALEFFEFYELCLSCLEFLTSELSCKPYTVDVQRIRMVHCFEDWGFYKEAEVEGFKILENLREIDRRSKTDHSDGRTFSDVDKSSVDKEFGLLFAEVVVTLVKCTAVSRSKHSGDYRRVLGLVEEVRPWFRILDAKASEKTHKALVAYLGKCTVLLVGELASFDENLVSSFCLITFTEYAKSSLKDQIFKLARSICSNLFSLQKKQEASVLVVDILKCILASTTLEWKDEVECISVEFLQLISYCVNRCRSASPDCSSFAKHLEEIAEDFYQKFTSLGMILRLYATGLKIFSKYPKGQNCGSSIDILVDDVDTMQNLANLNGCLGSYFCTGSRDSSKTCIIELKDSDEPACLRLNSKYGDAITSVPSRRDAYLPFYLDAFKFLCQQLAELVNSEKKKFLAEDEADSVLYDIQNILHQFCSVFLFCQSHAFDSESDNIVNTLLSVVVAAFTLSFRTRLDMKTSTYLIKHVITSQWIQLPALKHLVASLNNIGVILYRNKLVNEASKALKLCCRASWTCVIHFCRMLDDKSTPSNNKFSEDTILSFVNEVNLRSGFLVDILFQCEIHKVEKTVTEILRNWSIAANIFSGMPIPAQLVKQWVKMQCRHHKNGDVKESPPTLNRLLPSSVPMSKTLIGALLEQELVEYEAMTTLYPRFCQQSQMEILGTLFKEVYITSDCRLEKSRILMKKARALRIYETVSLEDCIQCLSEAISIMNDADGGMCSSGILHYHQLGVAYLLRALSTHEAEPNSKEVLQDIGSALSIWLNITSLDSLRDDQRLIFSEYMLLLLCNAFDLLSIKGCMDHYRDIYSLMIRLFKWKNVQSEKLITLIWESRRTSHAMCVVPVHEKVIAELAEHLGELPKRVDFWRQCLKISPVMLIGFQQNFSFLCPNYTQRFCNHEKSFQLDETVDEVKDTAYKLASQNPVSKSSIFLAGYLYFDLCERLVSNGFFTEALSCAKEAHQLRSKLLQEKFMYSTEQHAERNCGTTHVSQKLAYGIKNLQMNVSAARTIWSFDRISWDIEGCYISPMNVLQCYLESILQVGLLHEVIGNGLEAETLLQWGKSIACSQSLLLFEIVFCFTLGKIYRKKQLWGSAQKELERAREALMDSNLTSCLKCRMVLEVIVDQHLGDLFRNMHGNANENISGERLINAKELYESAVEKLNLLVWKNSISCPEEECVVSSVQVERKKTSKDSKKCKMRMNPLRSFQMDQGIKPESTVRMTRSRCQSLQSRSTSNNIEVQKDHSGHLEGNVPDNSSAFDQGELLLEVTTLGCNDLCKNSKVKCWQCLPMEIMEAGQMENFIHMKWELVRRRLLLRQLSGIVKCLGIRGQIHQMHEAILKCMSILVSRNLFIQAHPANEPMVLLDLVGRKIHGDMFAVERASMLYSICLFSFMHYNDSGTACCILSKVQSKTLVSWLMVAFALCSDVPVLTQKISRLLAVIYVISSSNERFSLPPSGKVLTENHWASYFHQASIGTHLNNQLFPYIIGSSYVRDLEFAKGFGTGEGIFKKLRMRHMAGTNLEENVMKFFDGLPSVALICLSLIGGDLACLLQNCLNFPSSIRGWILVSRLNSKHQPIVLLLPVENVLKEALEDYLNPHSDKFCERNDMTKRWQCPWGTSVIDEVVPAFRVILEENYLSSLVFPLEDTKMNRMLWWKRRTKLDDCLGKLLGTIEESWLGPWKYMFLGECSNKNDLDSSLNKLVFDLKSRCKINVNESLLKIILEAPEEVLEAVGSDLCSSTGCCIGGVRYHDNPRSDIFKNTSNSIHQLSASALDFILDAKRELEGKDKTCRGPIMFVLDVNVQMLPWENLPIFKSQEIYRMPSIGSICATLDGRFLQQEQISGIAATFPSIDPLDAFYLLNPSGDLSSTQIEFENWFKDQNLEGMAGYAPSSEELIGELKSHDLFIYFGHGSGAQYIPKHEIQKLDACAASLLMGCSSGSLTLNGCYVPQGIPLSYLKAGSPVIVANLWEVTDKDIDRFGKAILKAWLRERSCASSVCAQCDVIVKDFEAMKIGARRAKKKAPSKNQSTPYESDLKKSKDYCEHRRMIGSFLCEAREACNLRYLIGASPVCYGVPTCIKKKKDL